MGRDAIGKIRSEREISRPPGSSRGDCINLQISSNEVRGAQTAAVVKGRKLVCLNKKINTEPSGNARLRAT